MTPAWEAGNRERGTLDVDKLESAWQGGFWLRQGNKVHGRRELRQRVIEIPSAKFRDS